MNAPSMKREKIIQLLALAWLLLLGTMALVGPFGLLAWSEKSGLLEHRQAQIAALQEERDAMANRVERLSPDNVDPDLVGELIRQDLNMAHPDEYVIDLEEQP